MRYREVYKLMKQCYWFDKVTKAVFFYEPSDPLRDLDRCSESTIIFIDGGGPSPSWSVTTKFTGIDARELYPKSRLSKIKVSLPFVSVFSSSDEGTYSAYWHDYSQAELGHQLFVERGDRTPILDRVATRARLSHKLDIFDIPSVDEVILSKGEQEKYSIKHIKYKPVTLPISGFQSDIEGFMQL